MLLDKNYSIDADSAGCILNFTEQRTREKDGEEIEYIFNDKWYFLSIEQCLNKYLDLKIEKSQDVEDCVKKINEVRDIIKKSCIFAK